MPMIKCGEDNIPCPKDKRNPCCYNCPHFEDCDFEDKCNLTPEECGHEDFLYN